MTLSGDLDFMQSRNSLKRPKRVNEKSHDRDLRASQEFLACAATLCSFPYYSQHAAGSSRYFPPLYHLHARDGVRSLGIALRLRERSPGFTLKL